MGHSIGNAPSAAARSKDSKPLGQGIHIIDADRYHADPAPQPSLSNSLLRTLLQQTPRHAWLRHPKLNPLFASSAGSATFDIGTAAHGLLLEGIDGVAVIEADDWRTNAAKDARDAAYAKGKTPLLTKQYEGALQMVSAAKRYLDSTALAGILSCGKPEQTLLWQEAKTWCRARIDFLSDDRKMVLDYKTTAADGPAEWMRRHFIEHGYDTQSVFYPRGLAALGFPGARFIFLVQETRAPFMCYLVEPAESMLELARHKVGRALTLWRNCLASDQWPGYSIDVHQAEAPAWALKEEEAYA